MATHCSHPRHWYGSSMNCGRLRISLLSIEIKPLGQTALHGLHGISCAQWRMGKTPSSHGGMFSSPIFPGFDLRISAVCDQSFGISSSVTLRSRAIIRPLILPEKIAADASAISSASPASNTFIPYSRALMVNSFTGSRPTAMRIVSQENDFSDPEMGRNFSSIPAIVTDSTWSAPLAETTVCEV